MNICRVCECGSGLYPEKLFDGYGMYLCRACNMCRKSKLLYFRRDILGLYECDEVIDDDEDDWVDDDEDDDDEEEWEDDDDDEEDEEEEEEYKQ